MASSAWLGRSGRKALAVTITAVACMWSCGCASNNPQLAAKLQQLERDVNSLRADNLILKDRLEAMEDEAADKPARAAAPVSVPAPEDVTPSDRPQLQVVRLAPEATPAEAGAEPVVAKPAKRPVIVGDARGVSQRSSATSGAAVRRGPSYQRQRR